jgi:WD40 repeat protein
MKIKSLFCVAGLIIGMILFVTCSKDGDIIPPSSDSSNEIIELKAALKPVPPPIGMVSWWSGDGTTNDLVDGNHGILMNGASYAPGIVGQAFVFDGINDYVKVPKAANLDVGNQVTLEFWMKGDITNTMDQCCQGLVTTDFYSVEITGVGIHAFISSDQGNTFINTSGVNNGGAKLTSGIWHHVAETYDGEKLQLYVDGLRWGNPHYCTTWISPMLDESFLSIGSEDGRTTCPGCIHTRYFHGLIDEVSLYNRALTPNEILSIYKAGSKGKDKTKLYSTYSPELAYVATGPYIEIVDLDKMTISSVINVPARSLKVVPSLKIGCAITNEGVLTKFSLATKEVISTLSLGAETGSSDIAITPDGKIAFISLYYKHSIAVVNVENMTLVKTILLTDENDYPNGIEMGTNGAFVFVGNQVSGRVHVIDVKKAEVIKAIETGTDGVNDVALNQSGQFILATAYDYNEIVVIDAMNLTVKKFIKLSHSPTGISIPPSGQKAYAVGGDWLTVIDTKTLKVDNSVFLPGVGRRIGVNTKGNIALSTGIGTNKIILIDLKTFFITKTLFTQGSSPWYMDFLPGS